MNEISVMASRAAELDVTACGNYIHVIPLTVIRTIALQGRYLNLPNRDPNRPVFARIYDEGNAPVDSTRAAPVKCERTCPNPTISSWFFQRVARPER